MIFGEEMWSRSHNESELLYFFELFETKKVFRVLKASLHLYHLIRLDNILA